MKTIFRVLLALLLGPLALWAQNPPTVTLLNVSYDVSRELYHGINPLFVKQWQSDTNQQAVVAMSHGGSTAQAQKILEGLDADVVTMDQQTDMDTLAAAKFVARDWKDKFPYFSVPYSSTILFMVRGGNPKGIKDWDDLVKPGVRIILPNPRTSGNGRYSYLAAYGYALKHSGGDDTKAREFVGKLFKNVQILDVGGRSATTTFAQRGLGDVLLTFENEIAVIKNDPTYGGEKLQTVVPSLSIRADAPVAMVDRYVDQHRTRAVAEAYLRFLFSPTGQEEIARNHFRPSDNDCMLVTPICPHLLTIRPMVMPGDSSITITVEGVPNQIFLTVDGQEAVELRLGDEVRCCRSTHAVRLLRLRPNGLFNVLRSKLKWGVR